MNRLPDEHGCEAEGSPFSAESPNRPLPGVASAPVGRGAFSLIELLVVMTLLSFIIIGLLAVFDQTQRAFKTGMSQVDVLESGRATMDLITREVEQMASLTGLGSNVVNFIAEIPKDNGGNPIYNPLEQELPGSGFARTNILQEFFFISRVNQDWIGTGYFVDGGADGVGQLFRFSTNVSKRDLNQVLARAGVYDLYELYRSIDLTNFTRVADGVIHLKVNAYATNGYLVDPPYVYEFSTNRFSGRVDAFYDGSAAAVGSVFMDGYLPTTIEIELAVVEPDVWTRIEALPAAGTVRREYLETEAGKVHVFRQRVPIRRVDTDAYKQ